MKVTALLTSLLTCFYLSAQLPASFQEQQAAYQFIINWKTLEVTGHEQNVELFLQYIYQNESDFMFGQKSISPSTFEDFKEFQLEFIHPIDINNDQKLEIIYDGKQYNEKGMVRIYTAIGSEFCLKLMDEMGRISSVKRSENEFSIVIMDYPCCADFKTTFTYHPILFDDKKIDMNSQGVQSQLTTLFWGQLDSLDCSLVSSLPFFVKGNLELHFSPGIPLRAEAIHREQLKNIAVYKEGTRGVILNEYLAPDNRRWFFVAINGAEPFEKSVFENELKHAENKTVTGWILADEHVFTN